MHLDHNILIATRYITINILQFNHTHSIRQFNLHTLFLKFNGSAFIYTTILYIFVKP